ncbi:MAG TPA: lytic transglycosylase domain-containing protein [Bryobacteraceae bacterium]|nr:lytic transglycosylase domain-containing protein [Bryobacteraceae bacterium]
MKYSQLIVVGVAAVGLNISSPARELLTLKSGFSLEAESHQIREATVVLTTATGTVEFPTSELLNVQVFDDLQPAAGLLLPAAVAPRKSAEQLLSSAAAAQGLAPELIHSVAKIESNLDPKAVSPKGAIGLMQLMPETATNLGVTATDASENALGGAKYLRQLLLQYHGNAALALAAYNAGPEAVMRYGGVPPFPETRRYVVKVLQELARERTAAHSKSAAPAAAK